MPAALYSQLQHVALTGTRRFPLSKLIASFTPSSSPTEQALHCALTQTDAPEPLRLLRAIAIAAVTERATWQPEPVPEAMQPAILPAPAAPSFSADLVQQMRSFVNTNGNEERFLCIALLRCLREAKQSLPSELLVSALELGSHRPGYSSDQEIQPYVSPVLGARGNWLAQQNPRWQWAAWLPADKDHETLWQHGTAQQRQALLLEERKTHPDTARERLAASFEQMNSKECLSMLETLAINLSMNDEPFLESLLQRAVRKIGRNAHRQAVDLLDKLPQSRHCQRIISIMQNLLHQDEKGQWHIEAPEDFDPIWECDGITPENYGAGAGRRGNCLYQLTAHTPLSFWTQTLDMSPAELYQWGNKTPWKNSLQQGWWTRVEGNLTPDFAWMSFYLNHTRRSYSRNALLLKLSQNQRETLWLECAPTQLDFTEIKHCQRHGNDYEFLSAELSQKLIHHIQLLAKRLRFRLASILAQLSNSKIEDNPDALNNLNCVLLFLDDSVLPQANTLLHTYQNQWSQHWPDLYQDTCNTLEKRQKFLACQQGIAAQAQSALK